MANYFIKNIGGFKKDKPDHKSIKFMPIEEYHKEARKMIRTYAPSYAPLFKVEEMLSGEDYVSEVAMHIMRADWTYQEEKSNGKTPDNYRIQCAIFGIRDCLGLTKRKANKQLQSLDAKIGEVDDDVSPLSFHADVIAEPYKIVGRADRRERVRKYVNFLLKNANLSPVQQKCIYLKFFGGPYGVGIDSYKEIGEAFDPPVSRQNVKQIINRAIFKLKQVAVGSKG